jgi:hypothetical protein
MKKLIFIIILFTFFLTPFFQAAAQAAHDSTTTAVFDTTGFPQWAKDLRRWNIVSFGSYPFSMAFVNFFYDMYRWNNANGMEFTSEGRRYAPWPLRSAGAVEKTNTEFRNSLLMAAGVSATIALVDIMIVRRRRERESLIEERPTGSYTIERTPFPSDEAEDFPDTYDVYNPETSEGFSLFEIMPQEGGETSTE